VRRVRYLKLIALFKMAKGLLLMLYVIGYNASRS